jgi:uncharacterized membrane-anchored protein YhcB (DUF1043 family)
MMTILSFYWPALLVALLIGIVSGILAFRSPPGSR